MNFVLNKIAEAEKLIVSKQDYIDRLNNIDNDDKLKQEVRNEIYFSFIALKKRRMGRLKAKDLAHNSNIDVEAEQVLADYDKRFNTQKEFYHSY